MQVVRWCHVELSSLHVFNNPWPFWSSGGTRRQKKLLHIPRILSMSLWCGHPHPLQVCVWSAREKFLEILYHGWKLNPGHGEGRQWDTCILPLSYHDPGHGEDRQWDALIFPLSYHDPGQGEDRQRDVLIFPLSYHDPGHGKDRQWDTFILPPSYYDPGHVEDRQWDTLIFPLSYHGWLISVK